MGQSTSATAVLNFTGYITEHTQNFTGRERVFKEIDSWIAASDGTRFFIITGEPGSGKSSLATRLCQFSQGTVSPPAGLTHLSPGFLSAVHFCSSQSNLWLDSVRFAHSIATQLNTCYPTLYAEFLKESRYQHISIEGHATAGTVQTDAVNAGVYINTLLLSTPNAQKAFQQGVLEPLERVYNHGFTHSTIILVDALDESFLSGGKDSIAELLFKLQGLPHQVRFIVTTRPVTDILRPLQSSSATSYSLSSGPGLTLSLTDIGSYVHQMLKANPGLMTLLAPELSAETFTTIVQEKSEGNFLYVYHLLHMLNSQKEQITRGMINTLPEGLPGIYLEFLSRLTRGDLQVWTEQYAPIIEALVVAQEGLSEAQLASFTEKEQIKVRQALQKLRQLLDANDSLPPSKRTYTIYNQSFIDFLLDGDSAEEFWCELKTQHKRLADWCERGDIAAIWKDVKNNAMEQGRREYARKYYLAHLFQAREWQQLFSILDSTAYGQAKLLFDPSSYLFAQDLELGRRAAMSEEWTLEEGIDQLPRLWQYTLLRFSLSSRIDLYPPSAFYLLVLLGRKQEALDLIELLTDPTRQIYILLRIAALLQEQARDEAEWLPFVERAYKKWQQTSQDVQDVVRSTLIAVLIKTQQWEIVEPIIATADNDREWSDLSSGLAQAGQWEQARRVLQCIKDDDMRKIVLDELLEIATSKDWEQAQMLVSTIEQKELQVEALGYIGAILTARHEQKQAETKWTEAEKILDTIEDPESRQQGLQALCLSLIEAEQWEWAERISSSLKNKQQQTHALKKLGMGLARAQQWAEAERIILSLEPETDPEGSPGPFSFREHPAWGAPNAQQQANPWAAQQQPANSWAAQAGQGAAQQQPGVWGGQSAQDPWTRQQAAAQSWGTPQPQQGPTAFGGGNSSGLAWGQQPADPWAAPAAQQPYQGMGASAAPAGATKALQELVELLAEAQQWERAESMIHAIKNADVQAEVLKKLVLSLALAGHWEQTERIISSIKSKNIQIESWFEIANTCTQLQQWEQVQSALAEIDRTLEVIENNEVPIESAIDVTEHQNDDDWPWAPAPIRDTVTPGKLVDDALYKLTVSLLKMHQWRMAEDIIYRIEDLETRTALLQEMSVALLEEQQWQQAENTIHRIENPDTRAALLQQLSVALSKGQQWQQAERILDTLEAGKGKNQALVHLVRELVHSQEWEQARRICHRLEYPLYQATVFGHLGAMAAGAQQWPLATSLWAEAEAVINTIEDRYLQVRGLNQMLISFVEAGEVERAVNIHSEIEHLIPTIKGRESDDDDDLFLNILLYDAGTTTVEDRKARNKAWHDLAIALMEVQWWKEAESAIDHIEVLPNLSFLEKGIKVPLRHSTFETFVRALILVGEWEYAERMINKLEDEEFPQFTLPQNYYDLCVPLLCELALALFQGRQWQQAERISRILDKKSSHLPEAWWNREILLEEEKGEDFPGTWLSYVVNEDELWPQEKGGEGVFYDQSYFGTRNDRQKRAYTWWRLGVRLALLGHLQQAEEFYTIANALTYTLEKNEKKYEALITLAQALIRIQRGDEVTDIVRILADYQVPVEAWPSLLTVLIEYREWELAISIIPLCVKDEGPSEAYQKLNTALIQEGEWKLVVRTINAISHHNKETQERLLRNLCKVLLEQHEWNNEALDVLSSLAEHYEVLEPSKLIRLGEAFVHAGQWERLVKVLLVLDYRGGVYYAGSVLVKLAFVLAWRHKLEPGEALPSLQHEESLRSQAWLDLTHHIHLLAQEREQEEEDQTDSVQTKFDNSLNRLKSATFYTTLYEQAWQIGYLGTLLTQTQNEEYAATLWGRIEALLHMDASRRYVPNSTMHSNLSALFIQVQRWDLVERSISLMQEEEAHSDVPSEFSRAVFEAFSWDLAVDIISGSNTSFELGKALLLAGKRDLAEKIIFAREESASFIHKLIPVLLKSQQVVILVKLLNNPKSLSVIKTDDLEKICKGLIDLGAWEHAERVIEVLMKRKGLITTAREDDPGLHIQKGSHPVSQEHCQCSHGGKRPCSYHAYKARLLQKQVHIRKRAAQRSMKISHDSTRRRDEPGKAEIEAHQRERMLQEEREETRIQAFMQQVEALLPFIAKERAEQIFYQIVSLQLRPFPIDTMSRLCAKLISMQGGNFSRRLFDVIERDETGARFWCLVSQELSHAQAYEPAATALATAETIIQELKGNDSEDVWYNQDMLDYLTDPSHLEWGPYDPASLRSEAEVIPPALTPPALKKIVSEDIVRDQVGALIALGQWERAKTIIQKIKKARVRNPLWRNLALAFAEAKQWEDAERVTEMIDDPGFSISTYEALAKLMNETGDHQRLLHLIQDVLWKASTREEALAYFPLTTSVISYKPAIGIALKEAFSWVDAFLGY